MSFNSTMEPRVSYLSHLLMEIHNGFLKIPRFQRNLVWSRQQQRELLCSIFEGLPIGALLVWNTRLDNINTYEHIGPFPIKSNGLPNSNIYLMDGLQRLSTLYCTLIYPYETVPVSSTAAIKDFKVYCDLAADQVEDMFLFEDELSAGAELQYTYMPLRAAYNSKEFLLYQRSIPLEDVKTIDRADAIVTAFKSYKIPIIPLESDDQTLVTKSFERINSRGTIMSETHMLNALSYTEEFDLLGSIEKNREEHLFELPRWKDIDTEFVLFLLKMKLGYELYSKDTDKLAKNINDDIVSSAFKAISRLANFSSGYLSIESPNMFPYRLQMLGLAYMFMCNKNSSPENLKAWFFITTYTNSFGTTARNSQRALSDLQIFMSEGKELPWTLNLKPAIQSLEGLQVHGGAARIKAWSLALAGSLSVTTSDNHDFEKTSPMMLRSFKGNERRPGFYFYLNDKTWKSFDMTKLSEKQKEGHFLNDLLIKLYLDGNFIQFAQERERMMFSWELDNFIIPSAFTAGIYDKIFQANK